ncbi:MAG: hypothetical protein OXH11_19980 [Candidatus Aminicenantes bacterium]|nr:hypothetical protein [Candidatus Aminicenantes bacterium]
MRLTSDGQNQTRWTDFIRRYVLRYAGFWLVVLAWAACYSPLLSGLRVVTYDALAQNFPAAAFSAKAIQQGDSPLWNPNLFAGHPALSDPQMFLFSPLFMPLMVLGDPHDIHWFTLVVALHVLLGGIGFYVLLRRVDVALLPAVLGAAVFMFGGYALTRLQHTTMILSYAYFPWALVLLRRLLSSPRVGVAAGFGVVAGGMAAHGNQVAYLLSLVLAAAAVAAFFRAPDRVAFLLRKLPWLAAAGILAFLVLLPQLYGIFLFLDDSNRPHYEYAFAARQSMWPYIPATLLAPDLFGALGDNYVGADDRTESLLYVGGLGVWVLGFWGLWRGVLWTRRNLFFLAMLAFSLLYMLGDLTPAYRLFYEVIPGVALFQRPLDGGFLLNIALAGLVALVLDEVLRRDPERLPSRRMQLAGRVCLALLGAAFSIAIWKGVALQEDWQPVLEAVAAASVWVFASALALFLLLRYEQLRWPLSLALTALLVANLGWVNLNRRINVVPTGKISHPGGLPKAHRQIVEFIGEKTAPGESGAPPRRVDLIYAGAEMSNLPNLYPIHSISGANPFVSGRYQMFAGKRNVYSGPPLFSPMMPGYASEALDSLDVKYVITALDLEEYDPTYDSGELPLVERFANISVYENPDALPRVRLLNRFQIACSREQAAELLSSPSFSHHGNAVVELRNEQVPELQRVFGAGATPPCVDGSSLEISTEPGGPDQVRIVNYENDRVEVVADSGHPRLLVLADVLTEGWKAWLDGREVPIHYANYAFRGVFLPPGHHEISFRFRPFDADVALRVLRRILSGRDENPVPIRYR